ncbi:MAG: hypothetical protein IJJ35_11870 [Exiguobacterium sp.]|uniref:Tetratricopeptide repeat protein n=1 Tax=Exiguobacterium profundum TaxID=307643 RepID=A0ABY8B3D4_9BACL|nr:MULTISPECIES: hypothetical protein [Exiguobacterium]MBQ6460277.1 hypothetical protein [Exiguobacterium sp.]MBR2076642.1 hypothetical protein [Exiguobacterium sp.]WED55688.1 hypothetical protein OE059_02200 [Exiguobacterium profundum]
MDIRTLAERELSELPLFDMTEWLARKGEYDPSFRLVASEFGVITTLLDHGYYEEASERIVPLLGMKVPAAFHRLGLALEVKANGKKAAKRRFRSFSSAVIQHSDLAEWRQAFKFDKKWLGLPLVVGLAAVALVFWPDSEPPVVTPDEPDEVVVETVTEEEALAERLEELEAEVARLEKENEKLQDSDEQKPEESTEEAPDTSTDVVPLAEVESLVQGKQYEKADRLLDGNAKVGQEQAVGFYRLLVDNKLGQADIADYAAYLESYPESGYKADVLWMKGIAEKKANDPAYRETLTTVSEMEGTYWAPIAKSVLEE